MQIITDADTIFEMKKILDLNPDEPDLIRIYADSMGCSGPSFGLVLDEETPADLVYQIEDLTFVMEDGLYEEFGDFYIEFVHGGFLVKPTEEFESGCSSCASSCGF